MSTKQPGEAVTELLDQLLTGVRRAVLGEIGTAVSIAHPAPGRGAGRLRVLAATGVGTVLPPITTGHLWGPSLLAAAGEEPIVTSDLWHDPRWPHLTRDAVLSLLSDEHHQAVTRVRGVASMPGIWNDEGVLMLSVYLDRPADQRTLAALARHEPLVANAITIADIATSNAQDSERMLDALASRAAIDQAKGAIMALRRCDADEAWAVLRRASQEFNIKLRELAVALVEHIGHAPAQQPANTDDLIIPGLATRRTAGLIWQALTSSPPGDEPRPEEQTPAANPAPR